MQHRSYQFSCRLVAGPVSYLFGLLNLFILWKRFSLADVVCHPLTCTIVVLSVLCFVKLIG